MTWINWEFDALADEMRNVVNDNERLYRDEHALDLIGMPLAAASVRAIRQTHIVKALEYLASEQKAGRLVKSPGDRPRSRPDHNRYFALIAAAFHHWPSGHELMPEDELHLRGWLECKAKFCTYRDFHVEGDDPSDVDLVVRAAHEFARRETKDDKPQFVRVVGNTVRVYKPKSLKGLSQRDFAPVRDEVEKIITDVIGRPAAELIANTPAIEHLQERAA